MSLSKKGDQTDRRCALEVQRDIECSDLGADLEDWCYGCEFYVCANHSQNISLMGTHDVMEHLNDEDEDVDA